MPFALVRPQGGYIVVQPEGGVFAYDGAPFLQSLPRLDVIPEYPIVAGAWTPSGEGYWLLAGDGAIFAFGDAPGIVGSNVEPLKDKVGDRTIAGLVATGPRSVKLIAQEADGDFDTFELTAPG